jgi:subtilisin family serine protease
MWMSGTSFSSGLVSGVAAQLLALHPNWGPDDVKGALMLTARSLPLVTTRAAGVGEIDGNAASAVAVPPNPNENLYAFVKVDPVTGLKIFDADAWTSYASTHPTWSPANWSSVSWSSVSWSSVSWSSVSWSSVSWSSVSWSSVSWSSVSWSSVSWSSVSWSSATAVS